MVTIYVAAHNAMEFPSLERYSLLYVGRDDLAPNDSFGDSIGDRNKHYCELTGHYWIWKNDRRSSIVGLCQYRRFLWLECPPRMLCSKTFRSLDECGELISARNVERLLDGYDIILPRPYAFSRDTIGSQFCRFHGRENFDRLLRSVGRTHPEYSTAFGVFERRTAYLANVLIARREVFDEYSRWLFDVLFDVESRLDRADERNARLLGYMGERLLNLYVARNGLRVREVPLIFISTEESSARIDVRYVKRRYLPVLLTVEEWFRRK